VTERFDVLVIGAGPAGLAAALGLVRARLSVLVLDSARPRNAATLAAHGFITRDGISPLQLRKLGADELAGYGTKVLRSTVYSVSQTKDGFLVEHGDVSETVLARAVVLASGLTEQLPEISKLRAFYGTYLHSCVLCDGWEKRDKPLALIGESDDLAEWAMLIRNFSDDLVIFTNGIGQIAHSDEQLLRAKGIRIERERITEIAGSGRVGMTGVMLERSGTVPRIAGFVRPIWQPALDFVTELGLERATDGYLLSDGQARTSVPGVYAVGELVHGPTQLLISAGDGARVVPALLSDLTRKS